MYNALLYLFVFSLCGQLGGYKKVTNYRGNHTNTACRTTLQDIVRLDSAGTGTR
jgi:hypothetical protein